MSTSDFSREVFAVQNAEQEPWLEQVFIQPEEYDRYASNRSAIIFGAPGSGKTALRLALAREAGEHILVVPWSPNPPEKETDACGTPLLNLVMKQALQACAETIVLKSGMSARYAQANGWVSDSLRWFLQNYLPFGPEFYIQSQAFGLKDDEIKWYMDLFARPAQNIMDESLGNQARIRLLLATLKRAGFEKLWLMIDGLEKWPAGSTGCIDEMLDSIFSTLAVFENPDLVFKFFLPESMKDALEKTAGVERHRVETFTLKWDAARLESVLAKRLAFLCSDQDLSRSVLCSDPEFAKWLSTYGGSKPRAWLKLAKPIVDAWQRAGTALKPEEWRAIAASHAPQLRLDSKGRQVWVGERSVLINSPTEFRILMYLYENRERVCNMEELYYHCIAELNGIPEKDDAKRIDKVVWRRALDTTLWRIRQKLEPDPEHPVYLQTRPRQGYQLLNTTL
jgi:hypothetical protein